MKRARLGVALLWHMHQPIYRDERGVYRLPWVYLHAIKDYADMVAHLEANPAVRVTVNWTPTLLVQLTDYAQRLARWQRDGSPVGDPLLDALSGAVPLPTELAERQLLFIACQRANPPTMIHPWPRYQQLLEWVGQHGCCLDGSRLLYVNDHYFYDLLTWYHLAWCGASLKANHPTVKRLMAKGCAFTAEDRRMLVGVIAETIAAIPKRYRRLAECGQIELSVTPFGHPIGPLLLDFSAAHESRPNDPLPSRPYPGGEARLRWHIEQGFGLFRDHFGCDPVGVWPAEGGVSEAFLRLLAQYGVRWCASGESVWRASLLLSGWPKEEVARKRALFAPMKFAETDLALFCRDDGLSDLIGFQYQHWQVDEAVHHFTRALTDIARAFGDEAGQHTVLVALDGENAWEYYPENGWPFLERLYDRLTHHPEVVMRTVSDALAARTAPDRLARVRAGSWVQGTFATWIGSPAKNRAWEALVALKETIDRRWPDLDTATQTALAEQLAVCEASDWFWWFADHNPAEAVSEFDHLYRRHLTAAYALCGEPPPPTLAAPFAVGGGAAELGGVMQRGGA